MRLQEKCSVIAGQWTYLPWPLCEQEELVPSSHGVCGRAWGHCHRWDRTPPLLLIPGWSQQHAGAQLSCRSYPLCVSLSLLLALCFPKGSGYCHGVFVPTCALQEALPANQAEDQLIANTFGAVWVQTNDSHKAVRKVTFLMVWVKSTSFFSSKRQLLSTISSVATNCSVHSLGSS